MYSDLKIIKQLIVKYTFIILQLLISPSLLAIEFTRCVDSSGLVHYSNLTAAQLDTECKPIQHHQMVLLEQDYQRLNNGIIGTVEEKELLQIDEQESLLPKSISEALDADTALEQLLENTQQQRQNPATRFFKQRTEDIQNILDSVNPDT